MRIVQMSDVHVGSGLFRQDLLEATIEESNALAPDLVVVEGEAKVVALDSTKPDLDEGEVGREHYSWLDSEFRGWDAGPRILMIHHHILAVPGTGRDVNNLRDAGDVMAILRELKVDMVLSGHRHVPYVWSISGVRI